MFRVSFTGNLGSDPEERFTASGSRIMSVRVAVNTRRREGDEWKDRTDWLRVRAMGNLADRIQNLNKGDRVLVDGRLEIGEWTDRDGKDRTSLDVWADDVESLTPRPKSSQDGRQAPGGSSASLTPLRTSLDSSDAEDVPF
jgi:single-strand DNA-binding protein